MFVTPIALCLIGILCNVVALLYDAVNLLNFIYSAAYIIIWIILLYFTPKLKNKAVHMFYLGWWFACLYFAISEVFAFHLTAGMGFSIELIPYIAFISPLAGVQYLFTSQTAANYIITGICFLFFVIALCEALIFHNVTDRAVVIETDEQENK